MLATAFTWMMGLMGYIRSSVRLFWHVNEIMRDNSPWAYTHTVGFAANMISFNVLFFWVSILFVFWLGSLGMKKAPVEAEGRGSGRRTAAGWGPLIIFKDLGWGSGRHEERASLLPEPQEVTSVGDLSKGSSIDRVAAIRASRRSLRLFPGIRSKMVLQRSARLFKVFIGTIAAFLLLRGNCAL